MNTETGEVHRFASHAELMQYKASLERMDAVRDELKSALGDAQSKYKGVFLASDDPLPSAANFVELRGEPDPNCRKCFGRGHVGKNLTTGLFVPCSCCA
jgi:hypothetical protein